MEDTHLKRPLKNGKKYDKYFKKICSSAFLGNGDTALSIRIMVKWVNKYKHQCKELANEFKNKSIGQITDEVYEFLHDHIQYKIDGKAQKIRSPYCSWLDRENGIDCKSYSVFASCILSNLGIVHYLRKTKQPGYAPDSFSHVYVVVPEDQKQSFKKDSFSGDYYVIDATIHINSELPFIDKQDQLMEKVGLPHYGLGFAKEEPCSCHSNKKDVKPLYTSLGFGLMGDTINPDEEQNSNNQAYINAAFNAVSSGGWFDSTFGQLFANGFNFSCWGSSYSPSLAQDEVQRDINNVNQELANPSEASFNRWNFFVSARAGWALTKSQEDLANCSKEGYRLYHATITAYKATMMDALRQSGYVLQVTQQNAIPDLGDAFLNQWAAMNAFNYDYQIIKLKVPSNPSPIVLPSNPTNPTSPTSPTSPYTPTQPTTPGTPSQSNGGNTSKAGVGMILGIGTVAVLVGNYFYKKRKQK